ncbi:MAG: T9SS type A sorting domain-containing protein [Lewinella sp.]|nr:T9SS type A sorting domain-containing protein [Lewinella sp.]
MKNDFLKPIIMKRIFILFALFLFTAQTAGLTQTIWGGPKITFSKANNSDWTLEANQDRLTDHVWITRKNSQGIFNIATETGYVEDVSPADTKWAFGTTADLESLDFKDWETAVNENPPAMVNKDMVVHLITDSVYFDIKFLSWQGSGGGGGFSYERTTPNAVKTVEARQPDLMVFPNPAAFYLQIKGSSLKQKGVVYNLNGSQMLEVSPDPKGYVDIRSLPKGRLFNLAGNLSGTFRDQ